MSKHSALLGKLTTAIDAASASLVDRRQLVELVMLALIAREHLLFIGPPGTAKSAAVRLAAQQVGGRYFEYLIGRFTEPSEIFGSLNLEALRQGRVEPEVAGMLPEADIAFLDEIFLGSTAILNTLLTLLNERRYRRGHFETAAPLRSCVAAANHLPDEGMLQAFADRFLLTVFVEPTGDNALEELLTAGWRLDADNATSKPAMTVADIDALNKLAMAVDLTPIHGVYAHLVRKLRGHNVVLSDRRVVRGQKLIAAAATAAGRSVAEPADLWPVIYLVQDKPLQQEVRDLLARELEQSANAAMPEAVKDASFGIAARVQDLVARAAQLIDQKPDEDEAFEGWLVRAESLLAQIDAGFARDKLPPDLKERRDQLVAASLAERTREAAE